MSDYQHKDGKCNVDCTFCVGFVCELTGQLVDSNSDCNPYLSDLHKGMSPGPDTDGRAYMPKAKSQEWETPWWLFEELDIEFNFTVDAAASKSNAKMERYWTKEINGLIQDWTGESVFVNPPFLAAALRLWVEKAWIASREPDTTVVMIVPVKSDQPWWDNFAIKTEIRFMRGRIAFEGAKSTMPGPIAVLVFGKYITRKNVSIRKPSKRKCS